MVYFFKKIKKGKTYYYLGESKRIDGKVRRVWQRYLGPSDKFAEQLHNGIKPTEIDVLEFGLCSALLEINNDIKFVDIVDKIINKKEQGLSYGEHLLLTIINRLDNPSSHNQFGNWFDSTILKRIFPIKNIYLSSQNFWNHWNKITDEQIDNIQKELIKKLIVQYDISDLCYDPTNFTTYIADKHKTNPKGFIRHETNIAQYGKSKDGRKGFRQVNLSLLVTKKDGIPLWHHAYDGNINDVTEFKEFIDSMTNKISFFTKKCKKITLVLDKGNNSHKNINKIDKKIHFFVIGSLKPSQYSELFKIPLEEFDEEYITCKEKKVYCTSKIMDVYGGKKKVVITYSSELAYKNSVRVQKALNNAINKLKNLQGRILKTKKSRDDIIIKIHDIVGKSYIKGLIDYNLNEKYEGFDLTFCENKEAYAKISKKFGKNILFTDDLSLSTTEIVKTYNAKNIVEEQIKNLKDKHVISFTPMWCWTDKMIKVHAFTCVIALLFLRIMAKKVKDKKIQLSQDEIIENLKKIKLTILKMPFSDNINTKMSRLNKNQRALVKLLNLKKYE